MCKAGADGALWACCEGRGTFRPLVVGQERGCGLGPEAFRKFRVVVTTPCGPGRCVCPKGPQAPVQDSLSADSQEREPPFPRLGAHFVREGQDTGKQSYGLVNLRSPAVSRMRMSVPIGGWFTPPVL